jgi:hypothetical protein
MWGPPMVGLLNPPLPPISTRLFGSLLFQLLVFLKSLLTAACWRERKIHLGTPMSTNESASARIYRCSTSPKEYSKGYQIQGTMSAAS